MWLNISSVFSIQKNVYFCLSSDKGPMHWSNLCGWYLFCFESKVIRVLLSSPIDKLLNRQFSLILQYVNDISYHSLTALSVVETNKASGILKGKGPHKTEAILKFNKLLSYWPIESKVSIQITLRQLFIHGLKQLYLFLMTIKIFC